jgi:hypothetical protein
MTNKVFDIFEQEHGRTLIANYSRDLEEQRTLSFVSNVVRPPRAPPHAKAPVVTIRWCEPGVCLG